MEYISRLPSPPLAALVDDFYYLAGIPPYPRLTIPPMPSALLVVNLGAPFRITLRWCRRLRGRLRVGDMLENPDDVVVGDRVLHLRFRVRK
jgi:hypothetical protein